MLHCRRGYYTPYAQGSITGATTINATNGAIITATVTGNPTFTMPAGSFKGQILELRLTIGGVGSYTATKAGNMEMQGGAMPLTATVGALDVYTFRWDSVNWIEVSRSLNVS